MTVQQRISRQQAALHKAALLGTFRTVRDRGNGVYVVGGSTGRTYTVYALPDGLTCTCAAGERQIPCHHSAGTFMYRAGQSAFGKLRGAADREVWL